MSSSATPWDDRLYDSIRLWGRYIPDELSHAAKGEQGSQAPRFKQALPALGHEIAAMYLIGVVSCLEGTYGASSWKGKAVIPAVGSIPDIPVAKFEAAKKMRDALVHNGADLRRNRPSSRPTTEEESIIRQWQGVQVDETGGAFRIELSPSFIESVRKMFLALTQERDNWRSAP